MIYKSLKRDVTDCVTTSCNFHKRKAGHPSMVKSEIGVIDVSWLRGVIISLQLETARPLSILHKIGSNQARRLNAMMKQTQHNKGSQWLVI